ncbi:phage head completion protein [Streptomyces sp. NPDC003299]
MALLLAPHTVTVVRAPDGFDAEGNATTDWSTAERTTVRAHVEPAVSTENRDNRDQVATTYVVRLPPGTAVAYQDRLEWGGMTLEVSGDPLPWSSLAPLDHLQLTATRIRG